MVTIFQYIHMLKERQVEKNTFDEVQSLASLAFRFKEKYPPSQYTSRLAGLMQHGYPPENVLSGPSLIHEYDPELITENLNWLGDDNFRVTLTSQKFPGGIKPTKKERWYGTEYEVVNISDELRKKVQACGMNDAFHLPEKNEFIPSNFETHYDHKCLGSKESRSDLKTHPVCDCGTRRTTLFGSRKPMFGHCSATLWHMPHRMDQRLYTDLLKDSLNEYSYDAEVAGLHYNIENQLEGMLLGIGGYNDKLPV
ncbi:metalloprotease [Umbelopsis sp. WA50703]